MVRIEIREITGILGMTEKFCQKNPKYKLYKTSIWDLEQLERRLKNKNFRLNGGRINKIKAYCLKIKIDYPLLYVKANQVRFSWNDAEEKEKKEKLIQKIIGSNTSLRDQGI